MLKSSIRASRTISVLAVVSLALVASACSSSPKSSSKTSGLPSQVIATEDPEPGIVKLVPAAIASKGTLTIATAATYPTAEFVAPDKSLVGMDIDLGRALAQVMGLKAVFQNATFDTIIPGVQSQKFDMGLSSFTDTAARETIVDFVNYYQAGEAFYVKSGSTVKFSDLNSLCGRSVAVESGTTEQTDAQTQDKTCKAAGKTGVKVLSFADQSQTNLAVSSGRADVGFVDSPVAVYITTSSKGQFSLSGKFFGFAPYGIALPKGNGMTAPVKAALNQLIASGTYAQILKKWGMQGGSIDHVTINGAGSGL
jgi:polar amino acid transport system substrate-binding protein